MRMWNAAYAIVMAQSSEEAGRLQILGCYEECGGGNHLRSGGAGTPAWRLPLCLIRLVLVRRE